MSNKSNPNPILVLDGNKPSALAIVRSLGKRGLRVEVGSSKTRPIAGLSKYCSYHFVYPDPLFDVPGFRQAILERLRQRSYSLIIPVTDLTICPLMEIRESIEERSLLAMASNAALSLALSKSRTCDLAATLGIPIPKTFVVKDAKELQAVQEGLTYPTVIKADRSKMWSSNIRGHENAVAYALDRQELIEAATRFLPMGPIVLQEYIRGEGVGIGALACRGETVFAFQYRRLHEMPLTGGASSYRASEAIDPNLLDYAAALLRQLSWDGVAMVEFKRDARTGKTHLMEINGRFWGSLPLAVAAGADFPFYLFNLLVHQRREFPASYQLGVRCRELSSEVGWLKEVLFDRTQANGIVRLPSYRSILADTCRLLNPQEFSDTLDIRDPRPGIQNIWSVLQEIKQGILKKFWCAQAKRRMTRVQRQPKFLLDKLMRAKTVLFVCSGNFIRSPFAAQFFAQWIADKQSTAVLSAGLDATPGQQAHPNSIAKAKMLGFDLSGHAAVHLTGDMVVKADVVLVMEIAHLFLMRQRFPGSREKTFLLGCLSPEVPLEISDPVFKDAATFEACFGQIIKALEPAARMQANPIQYCEIGVHAVRK